MRVFKPRRVGVLFRTIERSQRCHFSIAGLLYVPLDAPQTLLPEAAMWKAVPKLIGAEAPLDEMVAKTHCEMLAAGSVFAPEGAPVPVCAARLRIGAVDKRIAAIGDRQWKRGVPTEPVPFTEMPLAWSRAFGGAGFDANPLGKGVAPVDGPDGKVHDLPNLEYPDKLVKSPGDRPPPACSLPIDISWPVRWKKAGSYDGNYLETDFPGLARDADWTLFNTASSDQWSEKPFAVDEAFLLENLHPTLRRIEGKLPGAAVRVLLIRKGQAEAEPTDLPMRLETVWFFPGALRAVLVYRGMIDVAEDDADDLDQLLIGCEDAAAPKPIGHYLEVMRARRDPETGARAATRDEDLLPAWPEGPEAELDDGMSAVKLENHALHNAHRKAERDILRSRAVVASFGLDPDKHAAGMPPPLRKPGEPRPAPKDVQAQLERAAAKQKEDDAARREYWRGEFAKLGLDYAVIEKERDTPPAGPPKAMAEEKLRWLEKTLAETRAQGVDLPDVAAMVTSPQYRGMLFDADDKQRDGYRLTAHARAPAARLDAESSQRLRAEVERRRREGVPLADFDLTGADLSGVEWAGADLRRVFLEGAVLRRANLAGANLAEAVLTRADLEGANLEGANCEGANLGGVSALDANLSGASLKRAVLAKARLDGTKLDGADLSEADLTEGTFVRASWRGVRASRTFFYKTNLAGLDLSAAELEHASFFEVDATAANFAEARLGAASFMGSKIDRANFARAKLGKVAFQLQSSAVEACFVGADAAESNFRGTNLDGADFTSARLDDCDFSTCSLKNAKLVRADARRARFVRAHLEQADLTGIDLMDGVLQKAYLDSARLDDANLYRADLSLVHGSKETTSKGANFTLTRVHPTRKKA